MCALQNMGKRSRGGGGGVRELHWEEASVRMESMRSRAEVSTTFLSKKEITAWHPALGKGVQYWWAVSRRLVPTCAGLSWIQKVGLGTGSLLRFHPSALQEGSQIFSCFERRPCMQSQLFCAYHFGSGPAGTFIQVFKYIKECV